MNKTYTILGRIFNAEKTSIFFFWACLGLVSRLFPHLPNVSPLLALALFAGKEFPKWLAITLTLVVLVCSDIILGLTQHHPLFGSWSIFTYSGFMAIAVCGSLLTSSSQHNILRRLIICVGGSALAYWLWTNLGVWLFGKMYAHTLAGLINCYLLALPFLKYSILGDCIWTTVIFGTPYLMPKYSPQHE